MQPIDWALTIVPILLVIGCAIYTRRYVRGVADFMAGGRAAGRYIICNAKGEASTGVANTLSKFQPILVAGFVLSWWDALSVPIYMLVAISGFVVYRYRQTRAMTIGQFFEMRYSRRFRLFAGVVGFLAGILNYGIFPAVSSDFFIYFLGLPHSVHLGALLLPTKLVLMFLYLSCVLVMMTVGGQITLLVTDCIEGILSHLVWLVVVLAIFCAVRWPQIRAALADAPPGHSLVNPFDQMQTKDFNVGYALMVLATTVYGTMAVQKDNGFSSAARTPHESRMGVVLGYWRTLARNVMLVVLAIGAMAALKRPDFPALADLRGIPDLQLRSQMEVPLALRYLLPVGVKGLFCLIMVLGLMSGDASHILTWGGVFVQDVILPLRGRPLPPELHVRILRWSVVGVAVFAFLFSALFHQTQYIAMWWLVTEGIFLCGAGAAIIGGLYWKRGTTAAAWAAFITGAGITLVSLCQSYFNGAEARAIAAAAAVMAYVGVSLVTRQKSFDMDRFLHRGKFAIAEDVAAKTTQKRGKFARTLGFDDDFTFWDKIVSGGIFIWSLFWLAVVVIGTAWNMIRPWPTVVWETYWLVTGIILPILIAAGTLVWFGIGGVLDLRIFFARLATQKEDTRDDGTVGEHGPPRPEKTPPKSATLS